MIRYVDIYAEENFKLVDVKSCLDYPACGYHESDEILIAGWVLPSNPLSNDLSVIVRVRNGESLHDYNAEKVIRPDVFKAKFPGSEFPLTAMQVGFSVRIPFTNSATASIIIVKDGEEFPWYKVNVVVNSTLSSFTRKMSYPLEPLVDPIDIQAVISNTKVYHPHVFNQYHQSVVHSHLRKLRSAVDNDEYIVSLYNSTDGNVHCLKSSLRFKICNTKPLNDHIFIFCRDEENIDFVIHQHVTSIDGVYYPKKGIYYSFCHGSQARIDSIIEILLKGRDLFNQREIKGKAFLIGHSRPYHFMYDGMLGLEIIHEHINKIDGKYQFYTLENNAFIDAIKVFNPSENVSFISGQKLLQLEQDGVLLIKIGALFGSGAADNTIVERIRSLDEKVRSYVNNKHDDNYHELKKHFPIIWLGVTGQKRAWLEQVDGYASIINKLYESFPGMAVIFDGWTSSLVSLQRDKIETENDKEIISEIINRIPENIKFVDLAGATIDNKIHIGSTVDCAIVNYSTGSINISRICGRPCITHMNNSFSPARNQHIHQNAYHVADEYVTDVIDSDSRIDSTSYHIDWENIYDAMTLHLGQHNLIQKRW